MERIHTSIGVAVTIHLIPAHAGVPGNETADEAAKQAAKGIVAARGDLTSPPSEILAAASTQANQFWQQEWKSLWESSSKGRHSYNITKEPTKNTLKLHAKLPNQKGHPDTATHRKDRTWRVPVRKKRPRVRLAAMQLQPGKPKRPARPSFLPEMDQGETGGLRKPTSPRPPENPRRTRPLLKAIEMILETGLLGQFARARELLAEIRERR